MNIKQEVFSKITELAKEQEYIIKLATAKEIDSNLKSFGLPFGDINKIQNLASSVQNTLRVLEKNINETLQEAKQIEIKAKELGLNAELETGIKYAQEKLKDISLANTLFSRFVSEIEKLK